MDYLQAIFLALVQGLTEFLPISSSAHLILFPKWFGWQDQRLSFDVAVHVGTLMAVVLYFRHTLRRLLYDWWRSVQTRQSHGDSGLAWAVIWASAPVAVAGLLLHDVVDNHLRTTLVIATTTLVFGLALWWADARGRRSRDERQVSWRDIIIIGCAQAISIIPGTSRSGITITAGLLLGLTREAAARFSFLLSIPTILMAGSYETYKLSKAPAAVDWNVLLLGAAVAGVAAYLCIHFFLKLLERIGMLPFVVYRVLLAGVLFYGAWQTAG